MSYVLNPGISATVGRSIVISGARRTGTSMMANLIHAARGVELVFEPPLLRALVPAIDRLPETEWRLLFEAYLFEDFAVDALAGRRLNLNENDDSCVINAKPREEIAARLAQGHRHTELFSAACNSRIAFKMPDINAYLARMASYYPAMSLLVMVRNPLSVIGSILRLGWFTDDRLAGISGDWPRRSGHRIAAPHWLNDAEVVSWETMSPEMRCCLYYKRIYDGIDHKIALVVDYDSFVRQPERGYALILERLGLEQGSLATNLIDAIYTPETPCASSIGPIIQRQLPGLEAVYDRLRERAVRP